MLGVEDATAQLKDAFRLCARRGAQATGAVRTLSESGQGLKLMEVDPVQQVSLSCKAQAGLLLFRWVGLSYVPLLCVKGTPFPVPWRPVQVPCSK